MVVGFCFFELTGFETRAHDSLLIIISSICTVVCFRYCLMEKPLGTELLMNYSRAVLDGGYVVTFRGAVS
jgi:hypothetical protein